MNQTEKLLIAQQSRKEKISDQNKNSDDFRPVDIKYDNQLHEDITKDEDKNTSENIENQKNASKNSEKILVEGTNSASDQTKKEFEKFDNISVKITTEEPHSEENSWQEDPIKPVGTVDQKYLDEELKQEEKRQNMAESAKNIVQEEKIEVKESETIVSSITRSPEHQALYEIDQALQTIDRESNQENRQQKKLDILKQNCKLFYQTSKTNLCNLADSKPKFSLLDHLGLGTVCNPKDSSGSMRIPRQYNFIVDKDRRLALCLPPKTSCTTWQRFYLAFKLNQIDYLNTKKDPTEDDEWNFYIYSRSPRLSSFIKDERINIETQLLEKNEDLTYDPKNYIGGPKSQENFIGESQKSKAKFYKILNTRHPFERIFSGWKDKFSKKNVYSSDTSWKWKRFYKEALNYNFTSKNKFFDKDVHDWKDWQGKLHPGITINFYTFVKYLLGEDFYHVDEHFKPISHHCAVCEVEYDFISDISGDNDDDNDGDLIAAFDHEKYVRNVKMAGVGDTILYNDRAMMMKIKQDKNNPDGSKLDALKYKITRYTGKDENGKLIKVQDDLQKSFTKAQIYFQEIAKLDYKLVLGLYQKYKWDFVLFGYQLEGYY